MLYNIYTVEVGVKAAGRGVEASRRFFESAPIDAFIRPPTDAGRHRV